MRTSVDVHNFLIERDIPHEVVQARGRLRSPERIAAALDLQLSEVGKVIVYEGAAGPIAAVVSSDTEPDSARVGKAAGQPELSRAPDDRASHLTEFLAEAIPPAGLPEDFTVVLDLTLARDVVLYFPGGEARSVLKIRGRDLARATKAKVAAISAPGGKARPAR